MMLRGLTWVRRPYRGGSWALVRAPKPGFRALPLYTSDEAQRPKMSGRGPHKSDRSMRPEHRPHRDTAMQSVRQVVETNDQAFRFGAVMLADQGVRMLVQQPICFSYLTSKSNAARS